MHSEKMANYRHKCCQVTKILVVITSGKV